MVEVLPPDCERSNSEPASSQPDTASELQACVRIEPQTFSLHSPHRKKVSGYINEKVL